MLEGREQEKIPGVRGLNDSPVPILLFSFYEVMTSVWMFPSYVFSTKPRKAAGRSCGETSRAREDRSTLLSVCQ